MPPAAPRRRAKRLATLLACAVLLPVVPRNMIHQILHKKYCHAMEGQADRRSRMQKAPDGWLPGAFPTTSSCTSNVNAAPNRATLHVQLFRQTLADSIVPRLHQTVLSRTLPGFHQSRLPDVAERPCGRNGRSCPRQDGRTGEVLRTTTGCAATCKTLRRLPAVVAIRPTPYTPAIAPPECTMHHAEVEVLPPGSIYVTRDRLAGCLAGMLEGARIAGRLPGAAGPDAIMEFLEKTIEPAAEGLIDSLCQGLVLDAPVEDVARRAALVARSHHADASSRAACIFTALWAHAQLRGLAGAYRAAGEALSRLAPELSVPGDFAACADDDRRIPRFAEPGPHATVVAARNALDTAHTQGRSWAAHIRQHPELLRDRELGALAGALWGLRHGLLAFDEPTVQAWQHSGSPVPAALLAASNVALSPDRGPPRTSQSHPLRIDAVKTASGALIGMTLCPGKQQPAGDTGAWARDMEADADVLRDFGAAAVITLLPDAEMAALSVQGLPSALAARGIEWVHAPMAEGRAPDYVPPGETPGGWFAGMAPSLLPRLHAHLQAGHNLVIHCKGGLGRTGVLAALLLLGQGRSPALTPEGAALLAMAEVRSARRNAIETVEQERAVLAWHASPGR